MITYSGWNPIFSSIIFVIIIQTAMLHSTAMLQTSSYRDYESYVNLRLEFKFEYPSDWEIQELDAPALSNLKGLVSLVPPKDIQELQAGDVVETPTISILAERIGFRNITPDELSRLQSDNIRYMFSDFDFNFDNTTEIVIGNDTAIKGVYTVVDPFTTNGDSPRIKNGMDIWTIRGDTVYTISYLGEQDQYFRYLPEVQSIIKSFKFIN
ncbi:MAG TPA: PsbP-related protein [Nitrososphaeraceae archaeon]|nr:PsbP-related protein [Nitrososphaeraceae archaeon]